MFTRGILTIFQIDGAQSDPITRFMAFWSLISALLSLLYGCFFIVRFSGMRRVHKAAEWAIVGMILPPNHSLLSILYTGGPTSTNSILECMGYVGNASDLASLVSRPFSSEMKVLNTCAGQFLRTSHALWLSCGESDLTNQMQRWFLESDPQQKAVFGSSSVVYWGSESFTLYLSSTRSGDTVPAWTELGSVGLKSSGNHTGRNSSCCVSHRLQFQMLELSRLPHLQSRPRPHYFHHRHLLFLQNHRHRYRLRSLGLGIIPHHPAHYVDAGHYPLPMLYFLRIFIECHLKANDPVHHKAWPRPIIPRQSKTEHWDFTSENLVNWMNHLPQTWMKELGVPKEREDQ